MTLEKIAVVAITKNGINISKNIANTIKFCKIYAPIKFSTKDKKITWYSKSTSDQIKDLFHKNDALICLFSLGAVIRIIASQIKSKDTDPAVIAIDDKAKFVISTLSGHIGGANELTSKLAIILNAIPVITTASEVNKTISVDMLGSKFNWSIESKSLITKISALMINEEKIGAYQEVGETSWRDKLPKNVTVYQNINTLKKSKSKAFLVISDRIIKDEYILNNSIIYRPRSLVIGIGLHHDTTKETIKNNLTKCLTMFDLSEKSIAKFATINKKFNVKGLIELSKEINIGIKYFERNELANINVPNPSKIVNKFEKTFSVAEASAILGSHGKLVIEKQKFPPDMTISIARIIN